MPDPSLRLLGLDPGLLRTGWGVIEIRGNRLTYVADGVVEVPGKRPLAERLVDLFRQIGDVIGRFEPDQAAVEESFVNKNPASTLKLGVARGVVLLAPAERGIPVSEYSTNLIKKSVVGVGHAEKAQVQMMVRRLLPGCLATSADAADALAAAICHAHHAQTARKISAALAPPPHPNPLPGGERGMEAARSTPSPQLGEGWGEGAREDSQRKPTPAETARARRLRRDGTSVEAKLWRHLRNRQIERVKFRRQEPILGYTVDFVAHEQRLVIELDGGQHADRVQQDGQRTRHLEQAGFRVLRFWNSDVSGNLDGVLETIRLACGGEG
jgi:crossover junction endodeoxyribonuclease RuvC